MSAACLWCRAPTRELLVGLLDNTHAAGATQQFLVASSGDGLAALPGRAGTAAAIVTRVLPNPEAPVADCQFPGLEEAERCVATVAVELRGVPRAEAAAEKVAPHLY